MSKLQLDLFGANVERAYALSQDFLRLNRVKVRKIVHKRKGISTIKLSAVQVSTDSADMVLESIRTAIHNSATTFAAQAKQLTQENFVLTQQEQEEGSPVTRARIDQAETEPIILDP